MAEGNAVRRTPVRVIGECINPSGQPCLQQALRGWDGALLIELARRQLLAGATWLDVNVHCPGAREKDLLRWAVGVLQAAVDAPLALDSGDPEALEAALPLCRGKAVLNSVTADEKTLRRLLPLARDCGTAVIGLTMDETGLPETAEARLALAERIVNAAAARGIPR